MLPFTTTNMPHGDDIMESDDYTKILFHNINGMKETTHWYQIMTTMKETQTDIFGFAEINRSLNRGYRNEWQEITRRVFYHSRMSHSESNIQMESAYKPGGTMTTITGKWQSRVTEVGQDSKGLGRWSYMIISSKKNQSLY
jgi:hypothetical protein